MPISRPARIPAFRYLAILAATAFLLLTLASRLTLHAADSDSDWSYVDHDLAGTRFSPLAQITPQNVTRLAQVCSYTFPEKVPSESAPIVSAGIMYLTSTHYTVALNGADCHILWTNQWTPRDRDSVHPSRGASLANGKIIRGTADDYLIAIDAETGHLAWAKQIASPKDGYFISMPPLIHGDLIYIGPAGSESAASGWVGAFRLTDGEQVWRFNIIPRDGEPGAETWGADPAARKYAGGALWTPLSYDNEKNLLYVSGGNPAPDYYDDARPGANLYTNSLIALDAKTGKLAWYNQFIPHDTHDYDITHVNPVFKINSRTAIASTGKDGVLRVVDRDSHKLLYSVPFVTHVNADAKTGPTPIRACPGPLGGSEWNSAAYSSALNLLVVPANDQWCGQIMKEKEAPNPETAHTGATRYFGGPIGLGPYSEARGRLTGFDAATGKERWRYESPSPMVAGVVVTASKLVFAGEVGGFFDALDAASGKVLDRINLSDSIQGGIITYAAQGAQYVAVISGDGGVINSKTMPIPATNPTVTVLALPK